MYGAIMSAVGSSISAIAGAGGGGSSYQRVIVAEMQNPSVVAQLESSLLNMKALANAYRSPPTFPRSALAKGHTMKRRVDRIRTERQTRALRRWGIIAGLAFGSPLAVMLFCMLWRLAIESIVG
jgi:hypothetical protein